jgi:hypothetical protein
MVNHHLVLHRQLKLDNLELQLVKLLQEMLLKDLLNKTLKLYLEILYIHQLHRPRS